VTDVDLEMFVDPVCPYCWVTSRWVVEVATQRGLQVRWRPISLWLLNREGADPTSSLSRLHRDGHARLRVMVAVEQALGPEPIGALYTALGEAIWEADAPAADGFRAVTEDIVASRDLVTPLAAAGLPVSFADAAEDAAYDGDISTSTDEALARVGGGAGTPVLSFGPPDGPAFFGPVLARVPEGDQALAVWDAVTTLASTASFAELKRSQRELPQVPRLARVGS